MNRDLTIEALLGASFDCGCGKHHSTRFSRMIMKSGAIAELPELLEELGKKRPHMVCDTHTWAVCGEKTAEILRAASVDLTFSVLESPEVGDLPADELSFGKLCMAFPTDCDLVISVGAGTINDLGRYLSYITGRDFILVLTAPSMDGAVSGVAPLIQNNLKVTLNAHAPVALVADLDIMTKAPMKMLSAGVGDILGKYNCLTDWKLSNIVNGEYFCPTIEGIMRGAIDKTMKAAEKLPERDPQDIRTLTEGLVLSGMAMDFAGNSRPASGAEHHISHYFEMQFLFDGIPAVLHGTKVGIGTVMMLRLYELLAGMEKPDFAALRKSAAERPSFEAWETEMKRAYRGGAPVVIDLEKKNGKNSTEGLLKRLDVIEARWDEIQALAASAPPSARIREVLESLGAPVRPEQVGVCPQYVEDGILYAKELRARYTILQLFWDLDLLKPAKDILMKEFVKDEPR